MSENLFLRKKINNLIKEIFEKTEESQIPAFDKEKAKEVVFAFVNDKIDKGSVKVEESSEMKVSDMVDANDSMEKGQAYKKENPIISFKYQGKEYSFLLEIEKEYSYETESGNWDTPSNETFELIDISLTHDEIEIGNWDGDVVKLYPTDLGKETFKKFEKTLLKFID